MSDNEKQKRIERTGAMLAALAQQSKERNEVVVVAYPNDSMMGQLISEYTAAVRHSPQIRVFRNEDGSPVTTTPIESDLENLDFQAWIANNLIL